MAEPVLEDYLKMLSIAFQARQDGRLFATTKEIIEKTMEALHYANRLAAGKVGRSDLLNGKRDKYQEKRRKRKAEGLCVDCGKPAESGYVTCASCRVERREFQRRWREKEMK